jgi:uncharacterized repeat protein (TIGR02543 family)
MKQKKFFYVFSFVLLLACAVFIGANNSSLLSYSFAEDSTYTVSFNSNGGSGTTMSDQTFTSGVSQNLSTNTYTKTGYDFSGWSTTTEGSVEYIDGAPYTIGTSNATLYAVWALHDYAISYNLNGGTVEGTNPTTYTIASDDITLTNPTKTGYDFAGWALGSSTTLVSTATITTGTTEDLEYSAFWKITVNDVTYRLLNFNEMTFSKIEGTDADVIMKTATNSITSNANIAIGYSYYGSIDGGEAQTYYIKQIGAGTAVDYSTLNSTFTNWSNISGVLVEDNITTIGAYSFSYFMTLKQISLPSTITSIGNYAFFNALIASFTLPKSVEIIGSYAFSSCNQLTTFSFEANSALTKISSYAFDMVPLISIALPKSVKTIDDYAFNEAHALTTFTIEDNSELSTIGNYAFNYCTSLTSFVLPKSVKSIGESAFTSPMLAVVTVPADSNLISIGANCFKGSQLNSIIIPSSVTSIGAGAFSGCHNLKSVTFATNSQLTSFADNLFKENYHLTSFNFPENLSTIGASAFYKCYNLFEELTIPSGVTTIGNSAFDSCFSLVSVTIPSTVTSLGTAIFLNCEKLVQITNLSSITLTVSTDFENNVGVEYRTSAETSFTNTLSDYDDNGIQLFTVGDEVYLIGVTGEETVVNLQNYSFTQVYPYLTYLNRSTNVTDLVLPSTVTAIGDYAFDSYKLSSLTVLATAVPTLSANSIYSSYAPTNIYVPSASLTSYQGATNWSSYSSAMSAIESQTFDVTFSANGGTGTAMSDQTFTYGVAQNLTANAYTRSGYTFAGWSTTSNGSVEFVDKASYTIGASDVTLYAVWTANTYSVSFDANGGTGDTMSDQTFTYNVAQDLTANTYTRSGYTFAGWSTTSAGTVQFVDEASYIIGAGNATLYAVWTANTYSVSFNPNGGTGDTMSDQTFTYGVAQDLADNTYTRTGYTFVGWAESSEGTMQYEDGASYTIGADNATLYAIWEETEYTITYNLNGGSVEEQNPSSYTYFDSFTLHNPTKLGYTFTGWTGTDLDTSTISVTISTSSTGNREYTANWQLANFSVTFSSNGGTGSMSNQSFTYNTAQNLTANTYTRTGYTFAGWSTTSNGSVEFVDEASYTIGADNVTLYAVWTANTYSVSFNANGGSGDAMSNQTFTFGVAQNLTANVYTRTGYVFAGWSTTVSGSVQYADGASYSTSASNVTLYAVWSANQHTITFETNGGADIENLQVAYNSNVQLPTPTKDGYTFDGWYYDEGLTSKADLTTMPDENLVLYAKWTKVNSTTIYLIISAIVIAVAVGAVITVIAVKKSKRKIYK